MDNIENIEAELKYLYYIDIQSLIKECLEEDNDSEENEIDMVFEKIFRKCAEYDNFLMLMPNPICHSFFGENRRDEYIISRKKKMIMQLKYHCILFVYYQLQANNFIKIKATNKVIFDNGYIKSQKNSIKQLGGAESNNYHQYKIRFMEKKENDSYGYRIIKALCDISDIVDSQKNGYIKSPGLSCTFINQIYEKSLFSKIDKIYAQIVSDNNITKRKYKNLICDLGMVHERNSYMDDPIDILFTEGLKEYYYPIHLLIKANDYINDIHESDTAISNLQGDMFKRIILETNHMKNVFSRQVFLDYALYCYKTVDNYSCDFLDMNKEISSIGRYVKPLEHNKSKDGQYLILEFIKTVSRFLIPVLEKTMYVVLIKYYKEKKQDKHVIRKLEEYIINNIDRIYCDFQDSSYAEDDENINNPLENTYIYKNFDVHFDDKMRLLISMVKDSRVDKTFSDLLNADIANINEDEVIQKVRREHILSLQYYLSM